MLHNYRIFVRVQIFYTHILFLLSCSSISSMSWLYGGSCSCKSLIQLKGHRVMQQNQQNIFYVLWADVHSVRHPFISVGVERKSSFRREKKTKMFQLVECSSHSQSMFVLSSSGKFVHLHKLYLLENSVIHFIICLKSVFILVESINLPFYLW